MMRSRLISIGSREEITVPVNESILAPLDSLTALRRAKRGRWKVKTYHWSKFSPPYLDWNPIQPQPYPLIRVHCTASKWQFRLMGWWEDDDPHRSSLSTTVSTAEFMSTYGTRWRGLRSDHEFEDLEDFMRCEMSRDGQWHFCLTSTDMLKSRMSFLIFGS